MNLAPHAKAIARALLGDPNPDHSSKSEWRFGSKGSRSVQVAGAKTGTWYDHEVKRGGGMLDLIIQERGVDKVGAYAWLRDELHIGEDDRAPPQGRYKVSGTWTYHDRGGGPVYRVVRRDCPGKPKRIHQERFDPAATGSYTAKKGCMKGVQLLPYRLPELLAASPETPVLIAEGERKADALAGLGFVATCNAGGAGKFPRAFGVYFGGRAVVLLPDNDDPGRDHVHKVGRILKPLAASLRVLEVPDLPKKGDIVDWLEAGGVPEEFAALLEAAPSFEEWAAEHAAPEREPEPASKAEPRPEILLRAEYFNEVVRTCSKALIDLVYMRGPLPRVLARVEPVGGHLVEDRDGAAVEIAGVRHRPGSLLFVEPAAQLIGWHLDERFRFCKFDGRIRDWVKVVCPATVAARVLGAATELGFRPCTGFCFVPLFHAGQIIATPGWHAPTGLIIDAPPLGTIPNTPTKEDALRALNTLMRPFRGYLQDNPTLRPGLAAGALTAALRPSLATAPGILIDGNNIGVGKGKVARTYGALNMGGIPSIVTEGHNEEEIEKRIAAAILQGSPTILLDNLQRPLSSVALESLLTEGAAEIRAFGTLTNISVHSRAFVAITANNARLRRDMLRRTLPIRIVVQDDRPHLRRFDFDPVEETLRDRAELLTAAFTIAKAWHIAGQKPEAAQIGRKPLGSFEQWAELVAGAVEWLTNVNPIDLVENAQAEDPAARAERMVIQRLAEEFGEGTFVARDAAQKIELDTWREVLSFKDTSQLAKQIGNWLGARRDRAFRIVLPDQETLVLVYLEASVKDRKGYVQWRIYPPF